MMALSGCLDEDASLAWLGALCCAVERGAKCIPDGPMMERSDSGYRDVVAVRRPLVRTVGNRAERAV
jgi:hypothetical protein